MEIPPWPGCKLRTLCTITQILKKHQLRHFWIRDNSISWSPEGISDALSHLLHTVWDMYGSFLILHWINASLNHFPPIQDICISREKNIIKSKDYFKSTNWIMKAEITDLYFIWQFKIRKEATPGNLESQSLTGNPSGLPTSTGAGKQLFAKLC